MIVTIDEAIALGMGRGVTVGAFSTGVAGGGAANVIDIDRPRLAIGVPAGVAIRPFRISAQVQAGAITADADETEILFAVDSLGMWTGDGAHTVQNPSNLRTDLQVGSMCRVGSIFTGDMTTTPGYAVIAAADPELDYELARAVLHFDVATNANQLKNDVSLVYEPDCPPILIGPTTLLVYYGGTVAVVGGFIQAQWVEGKIQDFVEAV